MEPVVKRVALGLRDAWRYSDWYLKPERVEKMAEEGLLIMVPGLVDAEAPESSVWEGALRELARRRGIAWELSPRDVISLDAARTEEGQIAVPKANVLICVEYDTEYGNLANRGFACRVVGARMVPVNPEALFSDPEVVDMYEELGKMRGCIRPLEENVEALKALSRRYELMWRRAEECGGDAGCWSKNGLHLAVVGRDVLLPMNLEVEGGKLVLIEEWYHCSEVEAGIVLD